MNSESREKIVEFEKYCHICKHDDKSPYEDPCDECISNPTNLDSHKPVKYEPKN